MATTFFGADWHLGHKNILSLEDRPFSSLEEMAENFFEHWHRNVTRQDTVYLLGDICFNNSYAQTFETLPGTKILIRGNHDHRQFASSKSIWQYSSGLAQIKLATQKIVLCHYPLEVWSCKEHGAAHLHGHCHGGVSHSCSVASNRYDVGYDAIKKPLATLEEIYAIYSRAGS